MPEYCKVMEESEVLDQSFQLIFAFDEIVALGYRESVNLAQIRTFTEMDSHEEKVYLAVRQVRNRLMQPIISHVNQTGYNSHVSDIIFTLHVFNALLNLLRPDGTYRETFQQIQERMKAILKDIVSIGPNTEGITLWNACIPCMNLVK